MFGYPVVRQRQKEVPLESAKVRALLTYLALHPDAPQARDYLAYLLWPDVPNETARKNLRQALYSLRKALGPAAAHVLDIQRDAVRLHPHPSMWVDVWAFERLEREVAAHPHRPYGACPYCQNRYTAMLALYREEFLQGFSTRDADPFEEWATEQREHYRQRVLAVVHQVTRFAYLRGRYPEAERFARLWLRWDPWSEAAYAYLIRALALQGRKGAALRAYQAYRQMMETELGLEPAPEAQRLMYDVQQGLLAEPESARLYRQLPHPLTPLVGREAELETVLYHLARPETRLISLVGLGGVGKSRLAEEVAREAITLFPDGVFWASLSTATAQDALTRLVEQLQPLLEASPGPEGLLQALRGRRALVVLDDIPPESEPLLRWLQTLLRQAREVVVLATSRQPLHLRAERRVLLSGLAYPQAEEDPLTPDAALGYPAVRLFVDRMQQLEPGFALSASNLADVLDMVRFTRGLPLALELAAAQAAHASCRVAAQALHQAALSLAAPYRDQPPQHRSLQVLLERSWQELSPELQQALQRLAHFSAPFDAELAQALAEVTPQALGRLTQYGLLQGFQEQPGVPALWEMHPLVRELARTKAAHAATTPEAWQARAWQWLREVLPQVTVSNTQRLHQLNALHEALRAFLRHLQQEGDAATVAAALGGVAAWFRHYGLLPELEQYLRQLEPLVTSWPSGEETDRARIVWHRFLAQVYYLTGQSAAAVEHLQRALALLQARPQWYAQHIPVLQTLAGVVQLQGDLETSRKYEEQALALCREALAQAPQAEQARTLWLDLANSLNNLGGLAFYEGRLDDAVRYYEEAIALYRRYESRVFLVNALMNYAHVLVRLGQLPKAQQVAEEAMRLAQAVGAQRPLANALDTLAMIAIHRNDPHTAVLRLRQAIHLAERANLNNLLIVFKTNLGIALAMLSQASEAETAFLGALTLAREYGVRYSEAETGVLYANFLMDQGRSDEALRTLQRALQVSVEHHFDSMTARILAYGVKWWALQGNRAQALALLRWLQARDLSPEDRGMLADWERLWFRKPSRSLRAEAEHLTADLDLRGWVQALLSASPS